jgi:hypothetical protein
VAQFGSALLWGGRGRGFKSRRPDHKLLILALVLAAGCGGSIGDFFERVFVTPATRTVRALGDRLKVASAMSNFSRAVTFLLADVLALPRIPALLLASAFDLRFDGDDPAKDLALEVKYDPAKLPDGVAEADLRLYRIVDDQATEVPGWVLDTSANVVRAPVRAEGVYAVAAPSE